MIHFFDRFKIPTLLGLGILLAGIIAGVLLTLNEQNLLLRASPQIEPKNITISNISATRATISWETSSPTAVLVSFGQVSVGEKTASDDRDFQSPTPRQTHYVTLKNLLPKTVYKYRIISDNTKSKLNDFETASPQSDQSDFGPVIGTVMDQELPLEEGLVYLNIPGAITQSSLIKNLGNFLIPLTDIYNLTDETVAKIRIVSPKGEASATFKVRAEGVVLPPLKLGENLDLTVSQIEPMEASPSAEELNIYDLNEDGKINAADNAIILNNFGRNPKEKRADLNGDGVVDQKDLNLMSKQINQ